MKLTTASFIISVFLCTFYSSNDALSCYQCSRSIPGCDKLDRKFLVACGIFDDRCYTSDRDRGCLEMDQDCILNTCCTSNGCNT